MSKYPRVASLDIDLMKSAIVITEGQKPIKSIFIKGKSNKFGSAIERIKYIVEKSIEKIKEYNVKYVMIETESLQSQGRYKITKGRLTGIVCYLLYENDFIIVEIAPTSIKKFIHKGNINKEQMATYVKLNFGIEYINKSGKHNYDLTDSYASSQLCLGLVYYSVKKEAPSYFTTHCKSEVERIYNENKFEQYSKKTGF